MNIFSAISRLIVGSLFVVSGLIKCNDAIGFSYKLNDYFAQDVLNLEFLIPYSLALAVIICVIEIVLGVAVIFGLKTKPSVVFILLMMLFFTWLTWYTSSCLEAQEAAAKLGEEFDKNCVTDCGCFGDALTLTPKQSFYKDLFLLIFTIPLFFFGIKGKILKNKPKEDVFYMVVSLLLILGFGALYIGWWFTLWFSIVLYAVVYALKNKTKSEWLPLIAAFVISLGYTWYCLQNLPLKDFRAYKVDSNITENMSVPEDAPKPVIDYHWKFKIDGVEKVITTNGSYPTVDGEFIGYETEVIEEGYEPSILDFSIETTEENLTEQFLNDEHLIIIAAYNINKIAPNSLEVIKALSKDAIKKGYTVIGLSASSEEDKAAFKASNDLGLEWYICDEKALKTVVRANPGILSLEKGTIKQKLHWKNSDNLVLVDLPDAKVKLNLELKKELDDIYALDQGVREIYFAETKEKKDSIAKALNLPVQEDALGYMKVWNDVDSINLVKVEEIIKKYGYPGIDLVGEPTNKAVWYVIQHSNKIPDYLPLIKESSKKGDIPLRLVAMMEDRYLMGKNEEQIYGTQGSSYFQGTDKEISFIWPIKDPENVNNLRREVGYTSTIEAYAKDLFGDNFEYKPYTIQELKDLGIIKD